MRTVFNILGPLSSPANTDIHLMGVFDPDYVEILANVQRNLGVKRAMVVHALMRMVNRLWMKYPL